MNTLSSTATPTATPAAAFNAVAATATATATATAAAAANVPSGSDFVVRGGALAACASLTRRHAQRLREVFRSAGWPCHDILEADLLAAGLLERRCSSQGHETVRLTDAGVRHLAQASQQNRAARSAHETLVGLVAERMQRDGRIVWQGLSLRADVSAAAGLVMPSARPEAGGETLASAADAASSLATGAEASTALAAGATGPSSQPRSLLDGDDAALGLGLPDEARAQWKLCRPDVFSIRNSSVPAYLDPIVHEIKVSRADLLGDLKKTDKRAAYLGLGGQCWYVLGQDARGRAIADPNEVPLECGVMVAVGDRLVVARMAPRRAATGLPFHVWMALARATPMPPGSGGALDGQDSLSEQGNEIDSI